MPPTPNELADIQKRLNAISVPTSLLLIIGYYFGKREKRNGETKH